MERHEKKQTDAPFSGARWIWDSSTGTGIDTRLRFRKSFNLPVRALSAELLITADARYVLWVNGNRIGRGPGRYWPGKIPFDRFDIAPYLNAGVSNTIAVMAHNFGFSTSQYILVRGGLYAALHIETAAGAITLDTDKSWRVASYAAFSGGPRINVSQGRSERFDARSDDPLWREPDFDDAPWQAATEVAVPDEGPWGPLVPSDSPSLTWEPVCPASVVSLRYLARAGASAPVSFGVSVDYKAVFYPEDTSTADRLQTGYLATIIQTASGGSGNFSLLDRKWPAEDERIVINGASFILQPGTDDASFPLEKGDNLFLLELAGAYQRFSTELFFTLPAGSALVSPVSEEAAPFGGAPATVPPITSSPIAAVGPFESVFIGNIVCAEDFAVDRGNAAFLAAGKAKKAAELSAFTLKPIPASEVELPSVKGLFVGKQALPTATSLKNATIPPGLARLCAQGGLPAELPLRPDTDAIFIVDFGREVSGFLEFELEADEGTVIDFLFFERMADGEPEIPADLNNTFRYICGEGIGRHQSEFRRGFRYAAVAVRPGPNPRRDVVAFRSFRLFESLWPVPSDDGFACSDPLLTKIAELSRRTLRLCMEDTYVDCPGFEQALWIGDARNNALVGYTAFGAYGLGKRSLLLAARSMERALVPECHVPAGVSLILTAWSLLWLVACGEYHAETGDKAFLEEISPYTTQAARAFLSMRDASGLIAPAAWNMFDWAGMDTPFRGVVAHQNATLVRALEVAAELARASGDSVSAAEFHHASADIDAAFNKVFWDETKGAYRDCIRADGSPSPVISVQTNLLALLWNCVPPNRKKRVESFVASPPSDAVLVGSPFASFFHHDYLASRGRVEELFQDIRTRWGAMVDYGSTTCWETFLGFYEGRLTRSYCHGWASGPLYHLLRHALGVRPEVRAEKHVIIIEPAAELLSWCRGRTHTPFGPVDAEWRVEAGTLTIRVSSPEDLECEVRPPDSYKNRTIVVLSTTENQR